MWTDYLNHGFSEQHVGSFVRLPQLRVKLALTASFVPDWGWWMNVNAIVMNEKMEVVS
jgi:hypothetical protein